MPYSGRIPLSGGLEPDEDGFHTGSFTSRRAVEHRLERELALRGVRREDGQKCTLTYAPCWLDTQGTHDTQRGRDDRPLGRISDQGARSGAPAGDNAYVWPIILPTIRFTPSTIDFATFADTASPSWIAVLRTPIHSRMRRCSTSVINPISSA